MADLWPASLPQLFAEPYRESPGDGTIRSEITDGALQIRERAHALPKRVSSRLLLSGAQKATLTTFENEHVATRFQWENREGLTRYYTFAQAIGFSSIKGGLYFYASLVLDEFATEFGGFSG